MKIGKDLEKVYRDNVALIGNPEAMAETAMEFQQIMVMYKAGIKQITTKLEILNTELCAGKSRSPIDTIKSRIKEPASIVEKLRKKGCPISLASMTQNLQDIAGVRVTCPFIADIYEIAAMLTNQEDIFLISMKDYIKNPKENGYRSLHLVVRTPVYFSDRKEDIVVEIQIRTIAMDFWASLEHQINYKNHNKPSPEMLKELKECADIIAETDKRMERLARKAPGVKGNMPMFAGLYDEELQ